MSNGKSVLITGASEGIGRAFARRLAAEGFAVTAIARNESRLQELITELAKREKPTVVSGVKNKIVTNLTRMLPRSGIVKMMAGY